MSLALGATFSAATSTSATSAVAANNGGADVALQAQLDRCNTQLSNWVNCSSGKTPEGKQIIAALQDKISTIKHQIQHQDQGGAQTPQNATSTVPPASLALAATGSVGTLLNTIA
jgi:hypothetical protein